MPGPVSTFCLSEGARRGFIAGPRITLGHAVVEFVMVMLLAFGLGPFLSQPLVTGPIALLGGVFLLWMGWGLAWGAWSGGVALDLDARVDTRGLARFGLERSGAIISLSNPYWFIWWLTYGASYVLMGLSFGIVGVFAFYFGHILADLTWNSLLSFIASSGRRVLTPGFYRWLLIAFGLFLIAFSLVFILSGTADLIGVVRRT